MSEEVAGDRGPVFELRGVRYVYGQRQVALDGIDLVIARGEQVALLGATGDFKGGSGNLKLGGGPIVVKGSKITAKASGINLKMGSSMKVG